MLLPIYLGICGARGQDSGHEAAAALMRGNLWTAIAVSIVHAAAMVVTGGVVAFAVHEWLGLSFISKSWFNLDAAWALSLILVGGIGVASAGCRIAVNPQLRRSDLGIPASRLLRLRRRREGAAEIGQRLAAGHKDVAQQEVAGQAESVGDLLGARRRLERRARAQESGQRQEAVAPSRLVAPMGRSDNPFARCAR